MSESALNEARDPLTDPDEMHDYLPDCEDLERVYDRTTGSVTSFELL